jgi:hypothetical protein
MQGMEDARRGDTIKYDAPCSGDERDIKIEESANATSAACLSFGARVREGHLPEIRTFIERIGAILKLYCSRYRRASIILHPDHRRSTCAMLEDALARERASWSIFCQK